MEKKLVGKVQGRLTVETAIGLCLGLIHLGLPPLILLDTPLPILLSLHINSIFLRLRL